MTDGMTDAEKILRDIFSAIAVSQPQNPEALDAFSDRVNNILLPLGWKLVRVLAGPAEVTR